MDKLETYNLFPYACWEGYSLFATVTSFEKENGGLITSFSADLDVIMFAFSGENGWSDFNKFNYFLCAIMYDKDIG